MATPYPFSGKLISKLWAWNSKMTTTQRHPICNNEQHPICNNLFFLMDTVALYSATEPIKKSGILFGITWSTLRLPSFKLPVFTGRFTYLQGVSLRFEKHRYAAAFRVHLQSWWRKCTGSVFTLLYIVTLGRCSKFVAGNKMLRLALWRLLNASAPSWCSSARRTFAAWSTSRLDCYRTIDSVCFHINELGFQVDEMSWFCTFHWNTAFEIYAPLLSSTAWLKFLKCVPPCGN